jgi:hypothetical protein
MSEQGHGRERRTPVQCAGLKRRDEGIGNGPGCHGADALSTPSHDLVVVERASIEHDKPRFGVGERFGVSYGYRFAEPGPVDLWSDFALVLEALKQRIHRARIQLRFTLGSRLAVV